MDHISEHYKIVFQKSPRGEVGENGCQTDDIVGVLVVEISELNAKIPCPENVEILSHLMAVKKLLNQRRDDRIQRGVEGYMKP